MAFRFKNRLMGSHYSSQRVNIQIYKHTVAVAMASSNADNRAKVIAALISAPVNPSESWANIFRSSSVTSTFWELHRTVKIASLSN